MKRWSYPYVPDLFMPTLTSNKEIYPVSYGSCNVYQAKNVDLERLGIFLFLLIQLVSDKKKNAFVDLYIHFFFFLQGLQTIEECICWTEYPY